MQQLHTMHNRRVEKRKAKAAEKRQVRRGKRLMAQAAPEASLLL